MAKASEKKSAGKAINLQTKFNEEILPQLKEKLGIKNSMAVPKVTKVKINVGIGTYVKNHNKDYSNIVDNIANIGGQKPMITTAKKAISNFKTRKGDKVGITTTLRGEKMYSFLNKLVNIVFPRVRDFRGISPKAFDGNGNFNIGFKEHTVFPEISPDDVMNLHGIQISITTSAKTDEMGLELLKLMGFPFIKKTN